MLPAPDDPALVDITVPGRKPRHRPGIRVHHAPSLDRGDVRRRHGLPLTAPDRTLLDLAATVGAQTLERAAANAEAARLTSRRSSLAHLARNRGRPGSAALRRVFERTGGPSLTRSEAERRLLALIRAADLPPPQINSRIAGLEVDFRWPEHRLVVEVDGYAFHSHRRAFERDRARDAALAAEGYTVIRITWRQLTDAPSAVTARIAAALAARTAL
jgi:very-short-patch-repair endonuclease